MTDIRNLDVAASASADLMELNNTVVSMRKIVKTAKVHVIRRLIQQLRRLKDKSDSDNKTKIREREIDIIKSLSCDKVSKYALGNTVKFADICRRPNCSLEIKALVRLVDNPVIQKTVSEFRKSHDDWQSLAMFLMAKQSGRRFHKQKNMKDKQTVLANRKTGDAMIENLVQQKLRGLDVEAVVGRKIVEKVVDSGGVSVGNRKRKKDKINYDKDVIGRTLSSKEELVKESKHTGMVKLKKKNSNVEVQSDFRMPLEAGNKAGVTPKTDAGDGSSDDELCDSDGNSGDNSLRKKENANKCGLGEKEDSLSSEEEDNSDGHDDEEDSDGHEDVNDSDGNIFHSDESGVDENGGFMISCSPDAVAKQLLKKEKTTRMREDKQENGVGMKFDTRESIDKGEMVVRQLDLSELNDDGEVMVVYSKVDSSEGQDEFSVSGKLKKRRDRFFAGDGEDDDDESDDDEDNDEEHNEDQQEDINRSSALRHIRSSFVSLGAADNEHSSSLDEHKKPFDRNQSQHDRNVGAGKKKEFAHKKTGYTHFERSADEERGQSQTGGSVWSRGRLQQESSKGHSMLKVEAQRIPAGRGVNHPSWEASRKRKEETAKIGVFRGKKTKFDDDDL